VWRLKPKVGESNEGVTIDISTFHKILEILSYNYAFLRVLMHSGTFLSRVSILTRDIDIAILSVRPSACLSVRPLRSGIL